MTTEQLDRRLDKIKDTSKILNFAQLAYENRNIYLLNKVNEKARKAGILLPDYQVNPILQEPETVRIFICDLCGITFPTRIRLVNHFCTGGLREERMFPERITMRAKPGKLLAKEEKPKLELNANGQPKRRCKRI